MQTGRKTQVAITEDLFAIVKRLKNEDVGKIKEYTNLSQSSIYGILRFISENPEGGVNDFLKKRGRKKVDKSGQEAMIRELFVQDNSLTQTAAREILAERGITVSVATVSRLVKSSGLTRKRLKKKPATVLTDSHRTSVIEYCSRISSLRNRSIMFLDECGFNLHTSNSYGYTPPNVDAIRFVPASRGQNVSLCGIFSRSGIEHFKLVDGAYNTEIFFWFLGGGN